MTKHEYLIQYKDAPKWELTRMKSALMVLGGFLNTEDDNNRLLAVIELLKDKKAKRFIDNHFMFINVGGSK
jgi:hypothetical protein